MSSTPNQNIQRLNALVELVEELKADHEGFKGLAAKRFQVLSAEVQLLQTNNKHLKHENQDLKKQINYVDNENAGEDSDDRTVLEGSSDLREGAFQIPNDGAMSADQAQKSLGAVSSKPVRDAILEAFSHYMGISNVQPKNLPAFPFGISKDHQKWPKDPSTQKPYHRYNWTLTADDPTNAESLQEIQAWVMDNAPTEIPEAAPMIQTVLPKDLRQKIRKKYQYLSRKYCKRHDKGADVVEEGLEDEGDVRKALSKAVRDSRAESKLEQHIRKRPLSWYEDSKYDVAFIINAMSDDEDDPDWRPTSAEIKNYISHAPDYRSPLQNYSKTGYVHGKFERTYSSVLTTKLVPSKLHQTERPGETTVTRWMMTRQVVKIVREHILEMQLRS
ncbi:hypothetical protein SERLADRAFT_410481 [Serpula lacrymans var. lacrymans S7.9]|uniref:Uncharacterized protein n=1 Tax=Serpula lacrymans var. lacrymans (strain S7.9) TaxID=578457 RepID=F8P649_SERL9|nr:uncharacterized protein SERLADRAFT_410481 [Serpula lacrymans var. lacrymans S7.9]EGO20916.1 hypothetical protein SERLADRAFT_410481 [Serpula lacrymans var. lacrymans S7.9]